MLRGLKSNQSKAPGLLPASGIRLVTNARPVRSQLLPDGQAGTSNNEITPWAHWIWPKLSCFLSSHRTMSEEQSWENPVPGSRAQGQAPAAPGLPFETEECGRAGWGGKSVTRFFRIYCALLTSWWLKDLPRNTLTQPWTTSVAQEEGRPCHASKLLSDVCSKIICVMLSLRPCSPVNSSSPQQVLDLIWVR